MENEQTRLFVVVAEQDQSAHYDLNKTLSAANFECVMVRDGEEVLEAVA